MYCYAVELAVGHGVKQNVECAIDLMQETAAMGYQPAIDFFK